MPPAGWASTPGPSPPKPTKSAPDSKSSVIGVLVKVVTVVLGEPPWFEIALDPPA